MYVHITSNEQQAACLMQQALYMTLTVHTQHAQTQHENEGRVPPGLQLCDT